MRRDKKITTLSPKDFKEEQTTVWSFKSRGSWATHNGDYRGNWSPYIPRNIILKYSKPGETVLDYFCGAGTTAVEAKLLGRKSISLDINKEAINLAKKNIDFRISDRQLSFIGEENPSQLYEPELRVGDARNLSFLKDNSIDLICAHPPYADIVHYTNQTEGDLSFLGVDDFLKEMAKVAQESYRVLKPGRQCAILIGDMRKNKNIIPLGFRLINVFLEVGFNLKELVIKRQHNCKTSGFWYANSIKYNFLLLAHEYLPVFEKPKTSTPLMIKEQKGTYGVLTLSREKPLLKSRLNEMETSTVWILPENEFEDRLNKNVIKRYSGKNRHQIINLTSGSKHKTKIPDNLTDLLFIKSSYLGNDNVNYGMINNYLDEVKKLVSKGLEHITRKGFCVIQTKDVRLNSYIEPVAKRIIDILSISNLLLKEIIILATDSHNNQSQSDNLKVSHQYLLVYKEAR
ncbi:MAG: DNA methyltransferase [Planctomycetota bacterium]|nr:DNA methyltransferase [Planctomycetota bacterium]MDI6786779.1 DNA methyltransferase [Planctomycetota bacterium]